jgi:hypothetical protein
MDDTRQTERDESLTTAKLAQGTTQQSANAELPDRSEDVETDYSTAGPDAGVRDGATTPLLESRESRSLCSEWDSIQANFVDAPRKAVERADNLVATTMKRLAETFSAERSRLEAQWDGGDKVSTEDLRLALQRYRSFFHRLLSV